MKNSAPQPSARQVRCRRTINESAMHPVPAGTGQQPRIVAGYNLFVVGLGFIQSCHNRTSTRLLVEVLPLSWTRNNTLSKGKLHLGRNRKMKARTHLRCG